jgi:hypothetical protein
MKSRARKNDTSMAKEIERALTESVDGSAGNVSASGLDVNDSTDRDDADADTGAHDGRDAVDNVFAGLKSQVDQGQKYDDILDSLYHVIKDCLSGGLSFTQIAEKMNRVGLKTKTKKEWTNKNLSSVYYRYKERSAGAE